MYQKKDKRKVAGPLQAGPMQGGVDQPQVAPAQPGAMEQVGQMAMGKVAGAGIDKGMKAAGPLMDKAMTGIQSGIHSALTPALGAEATATGAMAAHPLMGAAGTGGATAAGALGGGAMAGLGTAMPMIGAGLLAGKMFGLFSEGGMVGPLASVQYKSEGGEAISTKHETTQDKAKAEQGWFKTIWNTVMGGGMADKAKKELESRGKKVDEAIKKSGG